MKKFSKVKYFGAVAAALLAVAPIAAPVVSQVASPSIAQAASQIDTDAQNLVNNTFKDTVNTDLSSVTDAKSVKGINESASYADVKAAGFSFEFVKNDDSKWGENPFKKYQVQITLDGNATGATGDELVNILTTNPQQSYNATVTVKAGQANTIIATKTVKVNNTWNWKASIKAGETTVGHSALPYKNVATAASDMSATNGDNQNVPVYSSDFNAKNFVSIAKGSVKGSVAANAILAGDDASIVDNKFTENGMFYAVYRVQNSATSSLKNTLDKVLSHSTAKYSDTLATIVAKGGFFSYYKNDYVVRPINVKTSDTDVAYLPVFKYIFAKATATTAQRVDTYRNGQTVQLNSTDAGKLSVAPANDKTSPDDTWTNLSKTIYNMLNKQLYALQDSYMTTAGKPSATATISAIEASLKTAVQKAIPNVYKNGSYNVPVTVVNDKGYSATVNVPVNIGVEVGGPVARVFPVNTTITKGSSFDRYADVSFQNSDSDSTLIPNSDISVSGTVDTTTPGNYTLTYTVTNPAGKTGTFVRTITVVDGALTESNASGTVYINKADGATIYSDQATTKATDRTLDNTTAWAFHSVVKDSAGKIVAYNLGGKQYVKAADVSTSAVKKQAGIFTVHYPANAKWAIAVYNEDLKTVKLIPANSTWATFGTKTLKDGKSYYNLGGNQWVRTDYGYWNAK